MDISGPNSIVSATQRCLIMVDVCSIRQDPEIVYLCFDGIRYKCMLNTTADLSISLKFIS